jgi:hypothetical protein
LQALRTVLHDPRWGLCFQRRALFILKLCSCNVSSAEAFRNAIKLLDDHDSLKIPRERLRKTEKMLIEMAGN